MKKKQLKLLIIKRGRIPKKNKNEYIAKKREFNKLDQ